MKLGYETVGLGRRKAVKSMPFPEKNGKVPFNASGVAQVGPRRFVFVDNNDSAFFEFALDADGAHVKRIRRRQLAGVAKGRLRDPEGLTRVDLNGETFLIAASSLCVAGTNPSGRVQVNDGLVRVRYTPEGDLHAEASRPHRLTEIDAREPDGAFLQIRVPQGRRSWQA